MTSESPSSIEPSLPPLSPRLTLAMAAAAGLAVANIYYCQPMLGIIGRTFPASSATAMLPTATQFGYALGLILVVPLGDLLERRKLIVWQFALLGVALALAALSPSVATLIAASFLIGLTATVAQHIVPFAATLAGPERRGAVVGTVMAGLLGGILLSRTISGFVAAHLGWRPMFWLATPTALLGGGLMGLILPSYQPRTELSYGALLRSMKELWRELPSLRRAAWIQGLMFASFTGFWSVLALHLESPQYKLGADIAGLFGVLGAVGILAAPIAGRIADRHGPRMVMGISLSIGVLSWLVFWLWSSLAGLIVGVTLLDFGIQSTLIANQHTVFALRPEARARINTLFMGGMFMGGSLGSALATFAWKHGGWSNVALLGLLFTSAATLQLFIKRSAPAYEEHPALARPSPRSFAPLLPTNGREGRLASMARADIFSRARSISSRFIRHIGEAPAREAIVRTASEPERNTAHALLDDDLSQRLSARREHRHAHSRAGRADDAVQRGADPRRGPARARRAPSSCHRHTPALLRRQSAGH